MKGIGLFTAGILTAVLLTLMPLSAMAKESDPLNRPSEANGCSGLDLYTEIVSEDSCNNLYMYDEEQENKMYEFYRQSRGDGTAAHIRNGSRINQTT